MDRNLSPEARREAKREYMRNYHQRRKNDPDVSEARRAAGRRFYQKHKDYFKAAQQRRVASGENARYLRERYKTLGKDTHYRWTYGISLDQVKAMLDRQDGRCAICDEVIEKRPHLDHDHTSGKIRDILCQGCNLGLGGFSDSPERLRKAAEYLERHRDNSINPGYTGLYGP